MYSHKFWTPRSPPCSSNAARRAARHAVRCATPMQLAPRSSVCRSPRSSSAARPADRSAARRAVQTQLAVQLQRTPCSSNAVCQAAHDAARCIAEMQFASPLAMRLAVKPRRSLPFSSPCSSDASCRAARRAVGQRISSACSDSQCTKDCRLTLDGVCTFKRHVIGCK